MEERISQVIVPVDGSPAAAAAARHAALLARLLSVPLQLVHVMPLNPAELSDLPANRQAEADHDRARQRQAASDAFAQAREAIDSPLPTPPDEVTLHEEGFVPHPGRAIVAHANRHRRCLLVVGARHLSDMGKFVEGSVSNEIVHKVNAPVTVVHADAAPEALHRIDRVLLPVDGSPHCDHAAALAGELARGAEAPVSLLYCRTPGSAAGEADERELQQAAAQIFTQAHRALGEVPAGVEERILTGERYADTILEQVRRDTGHPVIVMGRRGLGTWRETLLGSVSHEVIDHAPCPVTVVV